MKKTEAQQETSGEGYPLHFTPHTSHFTPYTLHLPRILLVAALLGAPLALGAVVPWAWAALGVVAGLGLFLWALGCVQQGAVKLVWSPLYIPLAMFFLLAVAQYAARLTLDRSETRQALVLLAADLAFFFLAVQLFAGARSGTLRAFGLAVLLFAASMGLFAILQFASGARKIYGIVDTPSGKLFGPYVDPDHFAGLLEMLIPVAVLYIAGQRRRFSLEGSVLRVSAVTLALASLLLSGSRGGLLAVSAEIAIATIALRQAGARSTQGRRFALTAAITLLAGLMLFAYVDPGWAAKKLRSVASVDKAWAAWASDRKSMALDALHMWRDHPILGVGLGDFETAYPRYQSFPSDDWIDHAHNDYVEAFAETGLVGALLILSALALFLRLAFRDWGHPFRSPASWIRLGAALACCGMLVHSLFDFNLHIPANAAWFAVLAGIATSARASAATQDQISWGDGRWSIDD
jgi:O-antigen ligase